MSVDPARFRFVIWKGSTFSKRVQILDEDGLPLNLSGYTANLVARTEPGGSVLLTLDTSSGITLGGVNGTIDLFLSDEDTDAISWKSALYTLSLIDSGGNSGYVLYGPIRIKIV